MFFRSFFTSIGILAGICFLSFSSAFAANMPFTDIQPSDPFYTAIEELYTNNIISDDGSHLFHPEQAMNRDFYVALVVALGCKACAVPTQEEIVKYARSPFVDLPKSNPYYYCIAYAQDNDIAQGYILDLQGKTTCENNENYTSIPFCAQNSISRIEAVAVLLRRANLWSDELNAREQNKNIAIADVTDYWYGYAKKALSIDLIYKDADNAVFPDEKITRGEFAIMSAKILRYTQCQLDTSQNTVNGQILIVDREKNKIDKVVFFEGEDFHLIPQTSTPEKWVYEWTAINENGETIHHSGDTFPGELFPPGKWFIDLEIKDPETGEVVSNPEITIIVIPKPQDPEKDTDGDGTPDSKDHCPLVPGPKENNGCPPNDPSVKIPLGVALEARPLITPIEKEVTFTPTITPTGNPLTYHWDYGDKETGTQKDVTKHVYKEPGVYTVTLVVTDTVTGETGIAKVIITVTEIFDTDGDGVLDKDDACPLVQGPAELDGCPFIDVPDWACIIQTVYGDIRECFEGAEEKGDTDSNKYFENITKNICLLNTSKSRGLMIGGIECNRCPCLSDITITSPLRKCDIVFPTILSPMLTQIYSRGNFYLFQ